MSTRTKLVLKFAASILFLLAIAGEGYWIYRNFFGGIRKKLILEQKITVSGKDQNIRFKKRKRCKYPD